MKKEYDDQWYHPYPPPLHELPGKPMIVDEFPKFKHYRQDSNEQPHRQVEDIFVPV